MAHSAEIITDFHCTASFLAVAHSAQPNPPQWPLAHNKIRRHGPWRGKTLEFEFLNEFESIFKTALNHESEDQLGTFGEITLDKKSHTTVPFRFGFLIPAVYCFEKRRTSW